MANTDLTWKWTNRVGYGQKTGSIGCKGPWMAMNPFAGARISQEPVRRGFGSGAVACLEFLAPGLWLLASLAFLLFCLVGCQSQQSVENLPQPNFNGPSIAAAPIVIPRAAPAPQAQAKPAPKAPEIAENIPREWIPASNIPKRDWY